MKRFISTKKCRRGSINAFMDGEFHSPVCNAADCLCDICEDNNSQTYNEPSTDFEEECFLSPEIHHRKDTARKSNNPTIVTCSKTPHNPYKVNKKRQREIGEESRITASVDIVLDNEFRSRKDFQCKTQENALLLRRIKEMLDTVLPVKCIICFLTKSQMCSADHIPIRRDIEFKRERMIQCFRSGNMLPDYCACRIPGCYLPQLWCKSYDKSLPPLERICKYKYILLDLLYALRILSNPIAKDFERILAENGKCNESEFLASECKIGNHRAINLVLVVFRLFESFKS